MQPPATKSSGQNQSGPDVCLTPPGIFIAYTNIGLLCMAVNPSSITRVSKSPALNQGSTIPMTIGDNPGTMSKQMQVGEFPAGSGKVFLDGLPAQRLSDQAKGNSSNAFGSCVSVASSPVLFGDARRAPGGRVMDAEELAALCRDPQSLSAAAAMLPGGIGLLRIALFTARLPTLVWNEIRRLEGEGLTALVIDLRGCPGGEIDAAVRLAGDFLPCGAAIATVTEEDGDEVVHRARGEATYRMPVCALVDSGTASAAELFAGALQANGRALVIGATTYGKGTAQRLVPCLEEGTMRYATVARFAAADGRAIQGIGVHPDLEVTAGPLCFGSEEEPEGDAPLLGAWEAAVSGLAPGLGA